MNRTILFTALLVLNGFLVTGCEQQQKTAKVSQAVVKKYARATTLEGTVSNDKGIVKTGTVEVSDENGRLIRQAVVDDGRYRVEVPADTVLPILLTFSSGSGTEKLVAAVIHDTITKYDINPSTTA
ncbi:MAG: hypothetical protein ACXWFX_13520, partial [Methylobacter sp.]